MEFKKKLLSKRIMIVYERKLIAAKNCTYKAELRIKSTYNCTVTLIICTKTDNKSFNPDNIK